MGNVQSVELRANLRWSQRLQVKRNLNVICVIISLEWMNF